MFSTPIARQGVQAAFQGGTVSVLAGEMRNRRQAFFPDGRDEGFRGQRRIAARQVRHADDLDAVGFRRGFFDEGLRLVNVVVPAQDQFRRAEELASFPAPAANGSDSVPVHSRFIGLSLSSIVTSLEQALLSRHRTRFLSLRLAPVP